MDFRETGLPHDPLVYKAFLTYLQAMPAPKYAAGLAPPFSLRMARILHEAGVDDQSLLAGALLSTLPPQTWGMVGRRLGADVADLLREAEKHHLSDFAHIKHASDRMKLMTLASGLASLEEFKEQAADFDRGLAVLEGGAAASEMPVPLFENFRVFHRILAALTRQTSQPELEDLFAEKLDETRALQEEQIEKMRVAGVKPPPALRSGKTMQYPPFEATGLHDAPLVREAYDIVTHNLNVSPDDLHAAVKAGRLLGAAPETRDAAMIAAALVDISFRNMSDKDKDMLQGSLPWDVMDIIYDHSVYSVRSAHDLLKASVPPEFRCIALASAVVVLEEAHLLGQDILLLAERKAALPPGTHEEQMETVQLITEGIAKLYQPVIGTTEAPALEHIFEASLKNMRGFVAQHMPKPKAGPKFPPSSGFAP